MLRQSSVAFALAIALNSHGFGNLLTDGVGCRSKWVVGKVSIPCCGCRLAMPQKRANDRQRHTGPRAEAGKAVPEVMQAYIREAEEILNTFENTPARQSLLDLVRYSVKRKK